MTLWRISNHVTLTGEGARRASGRWHTKGRPIVYCASTPAAALLEILAHFEISVPDLPRRYRLLKLHAPDDLAVEHVSITDLPDDRVESAETTRMLGDEWLAKGRASLLTVPSAIIPETINVLLNPSHRDAARVIVTKISEHALDPRLFT